MFFTSWTISFTFSIGAKIAAIAPGTELPALLIDFPLSITALNPSSKDRAPATTKAAYSPKLWPPKRSAFIPSSANRLAIATSTTNIAGCVNFVSVNRFLLDSSESLSEPKTISLKL